MNDKREVIGNAVEQWLEEIGWEPVAGSGAVDHILKALREAGYHVAPIPPETNW